MPQKSVVDVAKEEVLAYNDKDWNRFRDCLTPDVVYDEVGTQRQAKGVEDVLSTCKGWANAIPDSRALLRSEMATGNTALLEMTWSGTHKGPLKIEGREIPATGKKIELRACQVVEVADGKIKSMRHYFDSATLLRQLGVEH
jgi:steroid delta-isomerase-like uncharacterized protein